MMVYDNLKLEVTEPIALLVVNRPQVLNALNKATLEELKKALLELGDDPRVKVLIITGEGEKAFVAGADISEMADMDAKQALEFSRLGHEAMRMVEEFPWPVIAAVNGYALGGGLELALACDIILASENARLGFPEVTLGICPGFGGTQRLARLIGKAKAKELIFTGEMVDARKAFELGIVNKVCPQGELLKEAKELALKIAKNGPLAVKVAKRLINEGLEGGLRRGEDLEVEAWAILFSTQDQKEGMKAFLEKRKPEFKAQ